METREASGSDLLTARNASPETPGKIKTCEPDFSKFPKTEIRCFDWSSVFDCKRFVSYSEAITET